MQYLFNVNTTSIFLLFPNQPILDEAIFFIFSMKKINIILIPLYMVLQILIILHLKFILLHQLLIYFSILQLKDHNQTQILILHSI